MKVAIGLITVAVLFQTGVSPRPTAGSNIAPPCVATAPMPILRPDTNALERMPVFKPDSAPRSNMPTNKLIPCYLIDSLPR